MYEENTQKEKNSWNKTNIILKICGNQWTLTEAHENYFYYGGKRKRIRLNKEGKLESVALGRKEGADFEQKKQNAVRVQRRRNNRIRDLINCNEDELNVFDTLTGTGDYRNLSDANKDRKEYFRRLERFCQTGKLYKKSIKHFAHDPDFKLKVVGVIEFQDGARLKKKGIHRQGTGNVHFHHFQNTPFLPQVNVIHAKVSNCEHYLSYKKGKGFFWSKIADRSTLWFCSEKEVFRFLQKNKRNFPGLYFNAELKKLCVNALLWEKGHTKIKKLPDLRKQGKCANAGEYLCQYVSQDKVDNRLKGRHGWYKYGKLEQPEIHRNPVEIDEIIKTVDLWSVFVSQIDFIADYIGAMTYYFFNFWVSVYPWIRIMYEKKAIKEKMSPADWISAGIYEPLLL